MVMPALQEMVLAQNGLKRIPRYQLLGTREVSCPNCGKTLMVAAVNDTNQTQPIIDKPTNKLSTNMAEWELQRHQSCECTAPKKLQRPAWLFPAKS